MIACARSPRSGFSLPSTPGPTRSPPSPPTTASVTSATGPGIFMKQPGTVVGPGDPIVYPRIGRSIIHEAEVGIVIGKAARHVSTEDALDHVLGYTCVNDVSARELATSDLGRGTSMRWKHFDTFCPIGPWIVTDLDGDSLGVQCRVNGATVVEGSTNDMLWGVAELISWVSEVMVLHPGDIIPSGCPDTDEIAIGRHRGCRGRRYRHAEESCRSRRVSGRPAFMPVEASPAIFRLQEPCARLLS